LAHIQRLRDPLPSSRSPQWWVDGADEPSPPARIEHIPSRSITPFFLSTAPFEDLSEIFGEKTQIIGAQ
jgi:hypothetical protein